MSFLDKAKKKAEEEAKKAAEAAKKAGEKGAGEVKKAAEKSKGENRLTLTNDPSTLILCRASHLSFFLKWPAENS